MRIFGLYGPRNMWHITMRAYLETDKIYGLTYDDKDDQLSECIQTTQVEKPTPQGYICNNRGAYESDLSINILKQMIGEDANQATFRTFNHISDDIELLSNTHIRMGGEIKHLSQATPLERKQLWDSLYPNVRDVAHQEQVEIETKPDDEIFAIVSCMDPIIKNSNNIISIDERLEMTLEQCRSIKRQCPKAKIILLELSLLPFHFLEQLCPLIDHIWLFDANSVSREFARSHKSLGEAYVTANLLTSLSTFNLFIKMTSRYKLLKRFDIQNLSKEKCTFKYTPKELTWSNQGALDSVCYSVPHREKNKIVSLLHNLLSGGLHIDIEHSLFKYLCPDGNPNSIQVSHQLDVIGYSAASLYNLL